MAANLDLLEPAHLSRKEKRKQSKKMRRKLIRQRVAEEEKSKTSVGLDDAAEQLRIQLEEQIEYERLAKEKAEHDEQERHWLERERKAMEDFQLQQEEIRKLEDARKPEDAEEDLEYFDDDGPAEIIWKGNEIIVRKRRVKVLPDSPAPRALQETSNPLPPQSAAFASHNKYVQTPSVSEQTPAFGTEQDKTHCPFHIKTGVCRFGVRCSRVHVYPEQSFTLLMRNMYTGPGLAWENDEGLEIFGTAGTKFRHSHQYMQGSLLDAVIVEIFRLLCFSPATCSFFGCLFTTILNKALKEDGRKRFRWLDEGNRATCHSDEEVAQHYEEFYEDVHSEFLQFGELVNFKVCNNASSHLRGNLYVHYKAEAGAQAAYSALNGRFYAGKQITCEFVGVTRWRVALCGEYMKGRHRLCSHGSACNFLHCFRNPSGEYDWADWDSPPPRSWVAKMAKLFGYEFDREQEHDHESHDEVRRRRRSPGSPPQRAYRHSERRSRDRRRHSNLDDCEKVDRLRDHRWEESGSTHYRSGSEDPRRGHRYRDGHKPLYSKELDERGSGHDWASNHGRHPAESEPPNRDDSELTGDAGEQEQQKRHKIDKVYIQGDEIDQSVYEKGGVSSRDRSRSSNRLVQDADDDSKYKRHRSRGHRDSDRRQSLDLRSSSKYRSRTSEIGSPADQAKSTAKDVPLKEKYHKRRVETRTHNDKSGKSVDNSSSSDKSDIDHGRKRHRGHSSRYSEGRRSRRKSITQEDESESEKFPNVDDRWTGVKES